MEQKSQPRQTRRKTLYGIVVSDKMQKTVTVRVENKTSHPLYGKRFSSHRKYHVHDEKEEAGPGDRVQIVECRPLSATKRFRLGKIVEKAK